MKTRHATLGLTKSGPFPIYSTSELLGFPSPTWLIDGILPAGGVIGLYGPPGSGKSFMALDMALCVASGLPWHDHEVQSCFVLYVSAEGGVGIGKRAAAWLSSNGVSAYTPNIGWLLQPLQVYADSADMAVLFDRLRNEIKETPTFIIIDTLARCLDGDENQQEDMGRFIAGIGQLQQEFDATVIVVHHTRKNSDDERGSTAFRGAVDTMLAVSREKNGPIVLQCNKQKDAEEFEDHSYTLHKVAAFDSCVIVAHQQETRRILREILAVGPLSYTELVQRTGWATTTLKRSLKRSLQNGEILKENDVWRLC